MYFVTKLLPRTLILARRKIFRQYFSFFPPPLQEEGQVGRVCAVWGAPDVAPGTDGAALESDISIDGEVTRSRVTSEFRLSVFYKVHCHGTEIHRSQIPPGQDRFAPAQGQTTSGHRHQKT